MDRVRPGNKPKDIWPYYSLAYLFLGVIPLLYPHATWLNWVGSLVSVAVFVPLYLRAYPAKARALVVDTLLMTALGLLTLPFNPWLTGTYIISAAACVANLEPVSHARRMIAFFALVSVGASFFSSPDWTARIITGLLWVFFSVLAGLSSLYAAERRRYTRRLEQAQEENQRLAVLAERERIGRDLHDVLGHTLSLIVLKAELARKLAERAPGRAALEMAEVERVAREALAQVREVVKGYRGSLGEELKQVRMALEAAGITHDLPLVPPSLPSTYEGGLALVLREAVTNVIRHSGASRVRIGLETAPEGVHLTIEDDGRGLGHSVEGNGLLGMRERVTALGGTLSVESGSGTRLSVLLPPAENRDTVSA